MLFPGQIEISYLSSGKWDGVSTDLLQKFCILVSIFESASEDEDELCARKFHV